MNNLKPIRTKIRYFSFKVQAPKTLVMRIVVCCLSLIIAVGCTKATPEFETLNEDSIPVPTFNGSKTKNIVTGNAGETFTINGECNAKIRDINGLAVGTASSFATLTGLATSAINVTCSTDGKFSFTLKSLTDLGYTPTEGTVYEIQIRGETSAGMSKASAIKILYSTAAGSSRPVRVVSGAVVGGADGTRAVGSTFQGDFRVTHQANQLAGATQSSPDEVIWKAGSTFKARVGIRNNYKD